MDMGLHLFDLARFLMGDVATRRLPHPAAQPADPRRGRLHRTLLGHADGAVSSVDCSFYARTTPDPFPETLARIDGPDGTIELDLGGRIRVHARRRSRDRRRPARARPGARGPGTSCRTRRRLRGARRRRARRPRRAAALRPAQPRNVSAITLACYRSAARRGDRRSRRLHRRRLPAMTHPAPAGSRPTTGSRPAGRSPRPPRRWPASSPPAPSSPFPARPPSSRSAPPPASP